MQALRAAPLIRWLSSRFPDSKMRPSRQARARLIQLTSDLVAQHRANLKQENDAGTPCCGRSCATDGMCQLSSSMLCTAGGPGARAWGGGQQCSTGHSLQALRAAHMHAVQLVWQPCGCCSVRVAMLPLACSGPDGIIIHAGRSASSRQLAAKHRTVICI